MFVLARWVITGRGYFDNFVAMARSLNREGLSGVFVLRTSGFGCLILGLFGLAAASDGVIQVVGNMSPSASLAGNQVDIIALVFAALVLLPMMLWLSRTGRPKWLVHPRIRDLSTEQVRALIRGK